MFVHLCIYIYYIYIYLFIKNIRPAQSLQHRKTASTLTQSSNKVAFKPSQSLQQNSPYNETASKPTPTSQPGPGHETASKL